MHERSFLICVVLLGVCALVSTAGMVALAFQGKETPASLTAVAGTCIGAIGGILSRPHQDKP